MTLRASAPPREPSSRPFILGLTGSIGMGKSAVAPMLNELGVPVFDADAAVHELQGPNGACLAPIERAFPGTTGPLGVDRQKLGAAVFGDPAKLELLESIVHPEVAEMRRTFLADNADAPLIVFDIPLLFEKTGQHGLDAVAVVSAPAEVQRERVLARPGMSAGKFEKILALQVPDADKRARADFVIDTGVPLAQTRAQVAALIAHLRENAPWPPLPASSEGSI